MFSFGKSLNVSNQICWSSIRNPFSSFSSSFIWRKSSTFDYWKKKHSFESFSTNSKKCSFVWRKSLSRLVTNSFSSHHFFKPTYQFYLTQNLLNEFRRHNFSNESKIRKIEFSAEDSEVTTIPVIVKYEGFVKRFFLFI